MNDFRTIEVEQSISDWFEEHVRKFPARIAFKTRKEALTWDELNRAANRVGWAILGTGESRDRPIALLLDPGASFLAAIMGVLKAGRFYVSLVTSHPRARNSYILGETEPALILTDSQNLSLARLLASSGCHLLNVEELDSTLSIENLGLRISPDSLMDVAYTSGSTGAPKGIIHTHREVLHKAVRGKQLQLCTDDRVANVGSLGRNIFSNLVGGAGSFPWNLKEEGLSQLADWLIQEEITVYRSVPTVFRQFASTLTGRDKFPKLRLILLTGEPTYKSDVELYRKHFSSDCLLVNNYGSAETGSIALFVIDKDTTIATDIVPVGHVLEDKEVLLLDDNGRQVGFNQVGEITVKSRYLSLAYWRRPDLNQKSFLTDPADGDKRVYRTGDLGLMSPDGCLMHLGRKDFQVKIRGNRVHLAEVEIALVSLETVKEAVVVAIEEPPGDQRLIAYVVPKEKPGPKISVFRRALAEKLPDFMVPSAFVVLDTLPLTSGGKVDRKALPAPSRARPELQTPFAAPRTPVEEELIQIWEELLGVDRVGIHDSFLDLGGHSLLAIQVISQIRKTFQIEIPLRSLFETPTVVGLAERIEATHRLNQRLEAPPILSVPRNATLPLSFAQQRLWFLDQLQPGSVAYNLSSALRLAGKLNVAALERSLTEILRRHEVLRTTFATVDGQPFQVISPAEPLVLPVIDLQSLSMAGREAEARRLAREEAHKPFDLAKGPLFRAYLSRLDEEDHILFYSMHHVISDGWSTRVFNKELSSFYQAFSTGQSPLLPELPVQYADFAVWQRKWLQGEVLETQLSYWKKQLEGIPVLHLPTDQPRPAFQTFSGGHEYLLLSKPLTEGLKNLSRQGGATLFMILLAAFKTLLYRHTGQEDIIVGVPIAGRNRVEIERLIGFFINTLVLRTDLSGNPTFSELLARVRTMALDAYAHQDLPFEKLVEELKPERDLSRTPLFQVFFNMLDLKGHEHKLPGLTVERLSISEPDSKFDLTLSAREKNEEIHLDLVYNANLFRRDRMVWMMGQFQTLLEAIVTNSNQPLSTLRLLRETERHIPSRWGNRARPNNLFIEFKKEDIGQSISARFEQQVTQFPDHIAVRTKNRQWTYRTLNQRANQIARTILRSCGLGQQRIGLLFEHDASMIAGILGVLKAGKTYVPLDSTYPPERLSYLLEDSQSTAVLTNNGNIALAKALNGATLQFINADEIDATVSTADLKLPISPDTLAYILYTSGSTGVPKGVMQSHRNVMHHIRNYINNLHLNSDDKLTLLSSYCFDAAVMDIFGALLNGAAVHPMDIKEEDPSALFHRVIIEKITIYHSTPTVYRYLLSNKAGRGDLSKVRFVVLGGEEAHKGDVDLFKRVFSPDSIFVNGLGPTESTLGLQYFINHKTEITGNIVPVGYPVEDTEVLLLNEEGEPTEVFGEIGIRSSHVALGYWQKPEMTRAVFLPDPEGTTRRIYRTGDIGRLLPDGSIGFVGRKDFQVKIRGYRIEVGEVEEVLSQHSAVREAVVMAREDFDTVCELPVAEGGGGDPKSKVENLKSANKRLVAYVVPHRGQALTIGGLRSFLKRKLPEYMVPSAYVFLDSLPLTPNGKVDRRSLPLPDDPSRPDLESRFLPPRTPIEEALGRIWAEVLKLDRVGIHDNFFDLGGHSLLATQVMSRVRQALQVELPLRSFFATPTVAGLAVAVVQTQAEGARGEQMVQVLTELERLSEDEARALLGEGALDKSI